VDAVDASARRRSTVHRVDAAGHIVSPVSWVLRVRAGVGGRVQWDGSGADLVTPVGSGRSSPV
jgi:hypothetical protein